jgi:hypothetical protein
MFAAQAKQAHVQRQAMLGASNEWSAAAILHLAQMKRGYTVCAHLASAAAGVGGSSSTVDQQLQLISI